MDPHSILEQLLESGRDLAHQGREFAERRLNLPEDPEQRKTAMSGLKKGAAAGGLLALLVGTRTGRRLSGQLFKVGTLAALGTLAFKTYQDWQLKHPSSRRDLGTPINKLGGAELATRSEKLIRAMIAATKADGHVDTAERDRIHQQVGEMGLDDQFVSLLAEELDRPVDAERIARLATTPGEAAEIYLASLMVVDVDDPQEREYLRQLAKKLELPAEYAREMESVANRADSE